MKKMSRILALLLAMMMLFALAACGSGSTDTPAPTEAPAANDAPQDAPDAPDAPEAPDAATDGQYVSTGVWPANPLGNVSLPLTEEEVDVTLWMGVNPGVLALTTDIGNDCVIWAELAERTGVHIEFDCVSPDVQNEKFYLMIASDDLADIYSSATSIYTGGGDAAVKDEVIIDHLPYLTEELTPQICKIMEAYPDAVPNALTDSGYLAGMPQLSMQTDTTQTFGPLIRKDWLDDLGLDIPETYDELHDVLVAFRDEKGADAALIINYAGTGFQNGLVQGYGIYGMAASGFGVTEPFYQVDDKIQFGPIQPEFKEYLTMVNEWYKDGLIWQDFMSTSDIQNPPSEVILANRAGVFWGEVVFIESLRELSDDPNFELVALPDFVKNKGDKIPFNDESNYTAQVPWSISTACECPELVMQWCNYLYTDDGALLANYGLEGQSFEFNEDGAPALTDLVLNNPDMNTTVALFMYCIDRGPFYRDEVREQSGYSENQKAASSIWQSNMTTGRAIGTTTLNAEESDRANLYYADIKDNVVENVLKFIIGSKPLDEFDAFVDEINRMNIDEVISCWQAAYDRYLSGEVVEMPMGPPPDGAPPPP